MQSASPSNLKISTAALIGQGVLAIGDGYRAKNVELAKHGYPFARAGNIDNGFDFGDADRFPEKDLHKVGEKTSRPGDVVFTSKGTVGRFAYVKDNTESFVYSPQLCYWRSLDHDVVHPRYLFYWMHGREFFEQATGLKGQTDMADYINLGDQRRMNLTLPSIGRQRAIASVLGALDDKIELNLQMNRTLEEMASALFKSWFVDFEPVLAKAEGRKPFGMDEATAALFPSEFEETDEGPVPKGWTWCAVADVADLNPESWSKRNAPDKVLYLDLSNVKWGVAEEPVEYRFSEAPSRARRVLRAEDTVLPTVRPANGSFFLVVEAPPFFTGSTGFAVLRPKSRRLTHFNYLATTRPDVIEYLAAVAEGSTSAYPAVSPNVIADVRLPFPPSEVLDALDQVVRNWFELQHRQRQETRTLADLRDLLLPKLLSGEIRLRDAEKSVEAAL